MSDNKCQGLGVVLGHKYEARFSDGAPTYNVSSKNITPELVVEVVKASMTKIYVHDICVRCGHIIHQEK